jgi:hypothetical protein
MKKQGKCLRLLSLRGSLTAPEVLVFACSEA